MDVRPKSSMSLRLRAVFKIQACFRALKMRRVLTEAIAEVEVKADEAPAAERGAAAGSETKAGGGRTKRSKRRESKSINMLYHGVVSSVSSWVSCVITTRTRLTI